MSARKSRQAKDEIVHAVIDVVIGVVKKHGPDAIKKVGKVIVEQGPGVLKQAARVAKKRVASVRSKRKLAREERSAQREAVGADSEAKTADATPVLQDYLARGLSVVFCGTSVAKASEERGGYYAGPGNQFWEYLFDSGITAELLSPEQSGRVLEYGAGLTDLVKAASASSDERLHAVDYDVPAFLAKIRDYQPAWVAFHGKTAANVVACYLDVGREVAYGPQGWRVEQARVFVLPSASGSNRRRDYEDTPDRREWFRRLARALHGSAPGVPSSLAGPTAATAEASSKLHDAMAAVLREHGEPLTARALSEEIATRGLYRKRNGENASSAQVRARAVRYPQLFILLPGRPARIGLCA